MDKTQSKISLAILNDVVIQCLKHKKSTIDRSDFVPINTANISNSIKDIFITAFGAFKIKPFRRIAIATFLVFNSFQVIAPLQQRRSQDVTNLLYFYCLTNDMMTPRVNKYTLKSIL